MKTNFDNKNFAVSLAFIMRFKETRKWPIRIVYTVYIESLTIYLVLNLKMNENGAV